MQARDGDKPWDALTGEGTGAGTDSDVEKGLAKKDASASAAGAP